ncbi:MAG: beta-galactosidase [bacterium]
MKNKREITAGVSYYPDHWPKKDWKRDLKLIKKSGLDIVRFGEFSWSWIEPEEGRFDFNGYDYFMELTQKLDLKVVLCTPTAAVPAWLHKKYPESKLINQRGETTDKGRHMTCYDNTQVRKLGERVIIKLAKRYKNHPSLLAWQIGNEPTFGESCERNNLFGYNPETVKKFRSYLKEKYQILDNLNKLWVNNFWSRSYSSWDEIYPPKKPNSPALWVEWLRFRSKNIVDYINWQEKILRSINEDFYIGTNIPETGPINSSLYAQNYWEQCKNLDYVGLDIYVYSDNPYKEKKEIGYSCDLLRAAAKSSDTDFWVSETQAGPHKRPWRQTFVGGLWGPEFLQRCTEKFVAHGAENILYFLWRPVRNGAEFGMNGMVNFDGSAHEITDSLSSILNKAKKQKGVLKTKPVIYMHYSRDSLYLASGYDPDNTPDTSLKGWYNLVTDLGYRVKFVNDEDIINKKWDSQEKLLLPYTLSVSNKLENKLTEIANKDVKIIAGFGTGFFDENASCKLRCPGDKLKEKFGIRVKGFEFDTKKEAIFKNDEDILLKGMFSEIEVDKGEVLLNDNENKPLIVRNDNVVYYAFDIGTIYKKSKVEKREKLITNYIYGLK